MVCVPGLKLKKDSLDFSMESNTLLLPAPKDDAEDETDLTAPDFIDFTADFVREETDFTFADAGRAEDFFFAALRTDGFLAVGFFKARAELFAATGLETRDEDDGLAGLETTPDDRLEGVANAGLPEEIELADVC
jgi:hypothetical protein